MVHKAGGETRRAGPMGIIVVVLVAVLFIAMGTVATLIIFEKKKEKAAHEVPPPLTAEEMAAEKERLAEEAEKTATWETFHCNLLHRYYDGAESSVPIAELIGISPDADPQTIKDRCVDLLPSVKRMGTLRRAWVAAGRFFETGDDELPFAYHCANMPGDTYDRRSAAMAYSGRAYGFYRPGHLQRAVNMMLKAVGLSPQGRLGAWLTRAAWWYLRRQASRLAVA